MGSLTLTLFGATAVTFMMLMYALERRGKGFVLAFALGCALSSTYGFLVGAWPFGVVEAIWAHVAARRYFDRDSRPTAVAQISSPRQFDRLGYVNVDQLASSPESDLAQ